jgi:NIMA (never in mitosis gene a)-related kinase
LVKSERDGSLYVIKMMDISAMSESERKESLKEAKILEAFDHPNIVKFKEVYKTRKGKL